MEEIQLERSLSAELVGRLSALDAMGTKAIRPVGLAAGFTPGFGRLRWGEFPHTIYRANKKKLSLFSHKM
jgi:hypothetical protein